MGLEYSILYLAVAPLIGAAAIFAARNVEALLDGRRGPSLLSFLLEVKGWFIQYELPIQPKIGLLSVAYLSGSVIAGGLLFFGGNLVIAAVFWLSASVAALIGITLSAPPDEKQVPSDQILWLAVYFIQIYLVSFGFFIVTLFSGNKGSFDMNAVVSLSGAPVYYLPGCFLGIALMLVLFPRESFSNNSLVVENSGRNLAFLEIGRIYEQVFLYGIIWLLHFGGTISSGILGLLVCLCIAMLSILVKSMQRQINEKPAVRAIMMLAPILFPLVNLTFLIR